MRRTLLPFFFALPIALSAQDTGDSAGFRIQPTFGLGAGMFAFYGDIGANHDGYNPLVTRLGFELRAGTPLTDYLDVSLFALHGQVGANERSLTRNLNFRSRITTGGFQFTYNFSHLLPSTRTVEPYIGLGLESIEFLSKTDLYDAQGNMYHYWSDGTIRDLPENDPNAANAQQLVRDHDYESDIRELDLDGFGKYAERTWGVPLSFGLRTLIGGGWDLKVGATMHYSFSDLVDGVTDESLGDRVGDARNDRFLYTSFTLSKSFDLDRKKRMDEKNPLSPEEMDLLVLNADEDGDGVLDFDDLCPGTPTGAKVSPRGCPFDDDMDGVANELDQELDSAPGAIVDANGVTITDEVWLKRHLDFIDSGDVKIVRSRVESLDNRKAGATVAAKPKRYYTVQVGSEVTGITEELMRQLLSIPDLRTVEHGDTISFVVGGYGDLPEAIRRQLQLQKEGINGVIVAQEGDALIDVSAEAQAARDAMGAGATPSSVPKGTVVRVQLGAFKGKLGRDIFKGIDDLVVLKGEDGITRYYTGSFSEMNPAAAHKVKMLKRGFSGAFLVAFKNGKRVSLKEAGARLTGPENLKTMPSGGVDKSLVRYRVQLGTFAGNVPSDVMSKYIEIGNVEPLTSVDAVRYYYGSFTSRAEAEDALKALKEKGLTDAFLVGSFASSIISAEDADALLKD